MTPVSVHVRTRFDGRVFVPEEPVDMPAGTMLEGTARRPLSPDEIQAILDSTAGAWADFDFIEPEELPYDKEESID